jgi:hypothetical protein
MMSGGFQNGVEEPGDSRGESGVKGNTIDLHNNIETKVSEMQEAMSCNGAGQALNEENDE